MTIPLSQYLSHRERVEATFRWLESVGLSTESLWTQHADLLASADSESPSEFDVRYELPVDRPTVLEHFDGKQPQVLSVGHLWAGYSYSLTPGQRAWLRDNYGMTPTQTITVLEVSAWPGTRHPRYLHIKSDFHVDPRNRRHVLVNAVIRQPGKFFTESAARDAELEAAREKAAAEREESTPKAKRTTKATTVEEYFKDLENL